MSKPAKPSVVAFRRFTMLNLLFFISLPWGEAAWAGDSPRWLAQGSQLVPAGAVVTLETDRPDYFLGENVLVHFVLKNTGEKPFDASWGGDYRGVNRHLRFKVTATDAAGRVAEDPDPSPMCMGGRGGSLSIKPGEDFTASLPLMRYCLIDQPGTYTIRVTHDFGWKEGGRKRPVGEITITFRMPSAAEAEQIVTQMEKLPTDPYSTLGQRAHEYADFGCLRYPIYQEPLLRRAQGGDKRAVAALGNLMTPEATQVLIGLAGAADAGLALEAARTLNARLPLPGSYKARPGQGWADHFAVRRRLAERTWNPQFAEETRALATVLIARKDPEAIALGASMLESIGTSEDAPALLAALARALPATVIPRCNPNDNILNQPQPIRELLAALQPLHAQAFALGDSLSGNAQILVYFSRLAGQPPPRPPRWLEMLDAFGMASPYPLREAAVRSIPLPLPAEGVKFVERALTDSDRGVCRAACELAGKSGNREFLKPLIEIIATENHEWLLRSASTAAMELGGGYDFLDAWTERLADERLYPLALDALQTRIDVPNGGCSGRTDLGRAERLELRKAWKTFLTLHAEEIRQGKRIPRDDATVTYALFGRARFWYLPDQTVWPAPPATAP